MSILRAIERAYRVADERNWDRVYWALDLHGTCLVSNYQGGTYEWISPECRDALKALSGFPETNLILWSSLHQRDKIGVSRFFDAEQVAFVDINANPYERNTSTGCFDQKFYMSIIVDDKAGFDPTEWPAVLDAVIECRRKYGFDLKIPV